MVKRAALSWRSNVLTLHALVFVRFLPQRFNMIRVAPLKWVVSVFSAMRDKTFPTALSMEKPSSCTTLVLRCNSN